MFVVNIIKEIPFIKFSLLLTIIQNVNLKSL